MERLIDRFDKYQEYKGLNDNKVTVQLDLSVGLIGKSRVEGHDLGKKTIEKILKFYNDLNRTWLLTGEGSMLNSEGIEPIHVPETKDEMLRYLMTQNERCNRVINDQSEIIKGLQKTIEKLQSQISEKNLASAVPEAGAGCAAVG